MSHDMSVHIPTNVHTYFSCSGGLDAEWVWPIVRVPLRGRDHLAEEGGVWINMKVLGNLQAFVDVVKGKGQKERFDLENKTK